MTLDKSFSLLVSFPTSVKNKALDQVHLSSCLLLMFYELSWKHRSVGLTTWDPEVNYLGSYPTRTTVDVFG